VLGKKNWLFTGSARISKRAVWIQGAKLNGIEPSARLKDTLEKLPSGLCDASMNSSAA